MGMFDRLYDSKGDEWQTKAFECYLTDYRIGDHIEFDADDCQVEIFGGPDNAPLQDSYATIKGGHLASVNDARNHRLPLFDYSGHRINRTEGE